MSLLLIIVIFLSFIFYYLFFLSLIIGRLLFEFRLCDGDGIGVGAGVAFNDHVENEYRIEILCSAF